MAHIVSDDAVMFLSPKDERNQFQTLHADAFAPLRAEYFTFMMHGESDGSAYIFDKPDEICPILKAWYQSKGKNRAILMITCWAGYKLAAKVVEYTGVPVLAGFGQVSFRWSEQAGSQLQVNGTNSVWGFFTSPTEATKLKCGTVLSQEEAISLAQTHRKK